MAINIKALLNEAVNAPSGENLQPWYFKVSGNKIQIFCVTGRDNSLYSWGNRSLFFAHGALIENIIIASNSHGIRTTVELFPEQKNEAYVASITCFEKKEAKKHTLAGEIMCRTTNRKPYQTTQLSKDEEGALFCEVEKMKETDAVLLLEKDRGRIKKLADALSQNEKILFGNRSMHSFFFNHINWTQEEEEKKRIGLYANTLELLPAQLRAFRLLRYWTIARALNTVGIGKIIARDNARTNTACGAMGAIILHDTSPRSYVNGGRMFERIWLHATQMNLSVQPLTGICFLKLYVDKCEEAELSQSHRKMVNRAYATIINTLEVQSGFVALLFRIGKSDSPPSACSLKRPPKII